MRVLITGARGMLGQCLAAAFGDHEVLAWDRSELDCTDGVAVRARLAATRPDAVVHAAAYNAVERAEVEADAADALNGEAVGTLAGAAAVVGATFVHYSTDFVFDGAQRGGYAEGDAPCPLNAYGRSKLLGEQALLAVVSRYPQWRWYLIRTSRLFGPAGMSASAKRSFVDTMISMSASRDRLALVDEEVAAPTYAPDLARATWEIIERALPSGIYHRTNAGSCTWYGFAREIFRITGWRGAVVPVPASAFPRPVKRPAYSVLTTTKLPPMRRWEEALAEYLTRSVPLPPTSRTHVVP